MKDIEHREDLIREIRKGLFNWYDFRLNSRILCVGKEDAYVYLLQKLPVEAERVSTEFINSKEWKKIIRVNLTISLQSKY